MPTARRSPAENPATNPSLGCEILIPYEPVDGLLQALDQRDTRFKPKGLACARHTQPPTRLSVRFGSIPSDAPGKAGHFHDHLRQVGDGDLPTTSDIHWLPAIILFSCQHDPVCGVMDMDKLARRLTSSPDSDRCTPGTLGIKAFLDDGGDDVRFVRVELVPRAIEIDQDQMDGVHVVFVPICLSLHQHEPLRQAIGGVGLLRVAVPERVFAKRYRA